MIAKKYKTTANELAGLNSIKNPNLIRAGATLKMPGFVTQSAQGTAGSGDTAGAESERADWEDLIDQIYENSKKAQIETLQGQYDTQYADYEKQKNDAPKKFDPLRNEAYVNTQMAERSRKEAMANMGLSGAGGMSQTLQQRNINTLLSTLGGISRQQQDFTDNVDFALGQLATQFESNKSSIRAHIDSEKNRAHLDQGNWQKNFDLQQDQFNLAKSDSNFNMAFQLYKKGSITKKEFELMTGIKLK
jgi:hypothetical protein